MRQWPTVALAAPACLLACAFAGALLAAVFDRHPLWSHQQWNLSEAAAVRDHAEVMRLIEFAEDPNVPREVREGLLFDHPVRLTPLEAAVIANDEHMVARLLSSGVVMNDATWNRLRCLADGEEVRRVLDQRSPDDAAVACESIIPP